MSLAEHQLESEVEILVTGCMGTCAAGPVLLVEPDGIFYTAMNPQKVADLVERHLIGGEVCEEYTFYDAEEERYIPKLDDINFFKEQVRIALRNCGRMEFASMEAYIARDGYAAAAKALDGLSREVVVEIMKASGLRGRGGAHYLERRGVVSAVRHGKERRHQGIRPCGRHYQRGNYRGPHGNTAGRHYL